MIWSFYVHFRVVWHFTPFFSLTVCPGRIVAHRGTIAPLAKPRTFAGVVALWSFFVTRFVVVFVVILNAKPLKKTET
jgi:hypothetical protein